MSVSRFLILIGSANHYHGDGIQPQALLSFYDDKGAWVFNTISHGKPLNAVWISDYEFMFDCPLLMVSLYLLKHSINEDYKDNNLIQKAKDFFKEDPYEKSYIIVPATVGRSSTNSIKKANLISLIDENKTILQNYSRLKFIAVNLGSNAVRVGGFEVDKMLQRFKKIIQDYNIKNFEICQSIDGQYFGAFDKEM